MAGPVEVLSRTCKVEGPDGAIADLVVRFYAPAQPWRPDDDRARANISCRFFERDVYGIGEDAAQAFFALPNVVTSYLIRQRRFGYECYWLEKGDLDMSDFWTYKL